MDLCGVDYLSLRPGRMGHDRRLPEGFSRGVEGEGPGRFNWADRPHAADMPHRFAVVVHLLSITHNRRLRMRVIARTTTCRSCRR